MEKLRVAVIGAGQVAQTSHINHYQSMEGVEVVAVCDTNRLAAKKAAEQFGIPAYYETHLELLDQIRPDAVSVCVPNKYHCGITCDALEHGSHVLCEKSPAITWDEALKMQRTAEKNGKLLTFGFHFRHADSVGILKQKIDNGDLGEIYAAKAVWTRRLGIPGWGCFTDKEIQGGGPLIDIGAHMLDLAVYLLDYPQISYVCAASSDRIGKRGGIGLMGAWNGAAYTVEDGLFGFVHFSNGTVLNLETSFALNIKEKEVRTVQLYGDKMGANAFPLETFGQDAGQPVNTVYPFMENRDWHGACIRNFVQACRGEARLRVTAEQAVYVQRLICSLYKSAETGKPVLY